MNSINTKKIVWAVDVMNSAELQRHSLFILGALTRSSNIKVEPVYVLGNPYVQALDAPFFDFREAFQSLAEKRLNELANASDLTNIDQGQVLVSAKGTVAKNVQCLLDYAQSVGAEAILVATHARKGMARLFMGSFAETLALTSQIPVFTVNPDTKVRERISKILHPTTFRPRYRKTFERVVALAKTVDAEVTLFYKEPVTPGFGRSQELLRFIAAEAETRSKIAEEWRLWANHEGLRINVVLDNEPGFLVSAIEDMAASQNFDLIAMATQADPLSAVLMGSHARQVMRHAPCPVCTMKLSESDRGATDET